uniref:DNA-directed RNA polymerase n=1 Tax=viral metagenome TaxID=1070528 RepID=A0A6C0EK23_9ZZZZ
MDVKTFENEYIWPILQSYYEENDIANTQIEQFDNFVTFGLQEIIDQESTIQIGDKYKAIFGQVSLATPQVIEEDRKLHGAYPSDARRRDLNYDAAIHCDVTEIFYDNDGKESDRKEHTRVVIGRMPVMLKSSICNLSKLSDDERVQQGECPNDPGGYFIIKGNERVLVSQLRAAYNQVIVLKQKPDEKYSYVAEIRSMSTETGHSILVKAMIDNDHRHIKFSLPFIKQPIPAGIVFKALGFTKDKDIINILGLDDTRKYKKFVRHILRDAIICQTQQEALKYIGESAIHIINKNQEEKYAWQVIETESFPHLGISGSIKEQACFLGNIIFKLLQTVIGLKKALIEDEDEDDENESKSRGEDDRDNYSNKRIDVAGALMYEIFRNSFKKYTGSIKTQMEKRKQRPDIMAIITRSKKITKDLHQCLSTGNWTVQKNANYVRTGVSQILERMTFGATLSHLRRILIPMGKEGKNAAMRQIHPSQFGFICPCETPEGGKVGIVLNFALMTKVSKKISPVVVREVIDGIEIITSVDDIDLALISKQSTVYLNNIPVGYTKDPETVVSTLRHMRKKRLLDEEVSITYDAIDDEIQIYCDEGRVIRPLFALKNNKLDLERIGKYKNNWGKMVRKGLIQFIDATEIENYVLAMNLDSLSKQKSDFCEIHPSCILGIMASIIPYPDHSQSPRNTYQSSMGKQALGVPVLSYNLRTDTKIHVLHYSQRPIVSTKTADMLGFNDMPSGVNAIVAIVPYGGYNQEDSIMMNESAIKRGMFGLTTDFTISDKEKKRDTYSYEQICLPPQSSDKVIKQGQPGYFKRKHANYSLLDKNGIIHARIPYEFRCMNQDCAKTWFDADFGYCPDCGKKSTKSRGGGGVPVRKGDVLIGKIIVSGNKKGEETRIDASRVVQDGEDGIIDRVHIHTTPDGYRLIKIVIRKTRYPEIGDKLASRAAQKGTIGRILAEKDMPFTESGLIPDLLINPLCMPSRMTVNQLIECALGKICCVKGEYGDATPFTSESINVADKIVAESAEIMKQHGLDSCGYETMYNGFTGEKMKVQIFIGPTYYQRLKHMVDDKMHARAKGHVTMLTHQPLEGRSRDGGLRFGEMERDCMISHGASEFLRERLFIASDPFTITVCDKCGVMTSMPSECQVCHGDRISKCNFPYASKLLTQELTAMGLKILIRATA